MCKAGILLLSLWCAWTADAQGVRTMPPKLPPTNKPVCSQGAICFSGEVSAGEEFRKELNSQLDFVLKPAWTIAIKPKHPEGDCEDGDFANVENPPYRAHREIYIDASYGWTAEQEVSVSPREFEFVTNCVDYRAESDRLSIVLWPYTAKSDKEYEEAMAKLGSVALGKGRLWITGSKISHANDTPDQNEGKIEWLQFSVEIVLPRGAPNGRPGLRVTPRAGECPRDQPRRAMRVPPAGVGELNLLLGGARLVNEPLSGALLARSGMFSSIVTLLKLNRLPEPITAPARIAVSTKIRASSRNRVPE